MQPDSRPGVPVVLVATAPVSDAQGRIPLVGRMGSWWLPGGSVEPGGSFIGAAIRELREETAGLVPGYGQLWQELPVAPTIAEVIEDGA